MRERIERRETSASSGTRFGKTPPSCDRQTPAKPVRARAERIWRATLKGKLGHFSRGRDPRTFHEDVELLAFHCRRRRGSFGDGGSCEDGRRAQCTEQRNRNIGALSKHLPRCNVTIEPETTGCPCCTGALHRIGEDVGEVLEKVPVNRPAKLPQGAHSSLVALTAALARAELVGVAQPGRSPKTLGHSR
jgi:hypothetical protein